MPSPRAYFDAFLSTVIADAKRFAHPDWVCFDTAFHVMLGIERFRGTDTVRELFARFTQRTIEDFWHPLGRWLLPLFEHPQQGFSLDLDTTQGVRAAKHKTHPPLLAVLAEVKCLLKLCVRSGNSSPSRGIL